MMFVPALFSHICLFSQERNHLSVLSLSPAGSVWTVVPSPSLKVWGCFWLFPGAATALLTSASAPAPLTSWPWLRNPVLTEAALPDRRPWLPLGCPERELVSFLWLWGCQHLAQCNARKGSWRAGRKVPAEGAGRGCAQPSQAAPLTT